MRVWQRTTLGLMLAATVAAVLWRLAPDGNRAIPTLTAILVFVTAWYADRTHEMVLEMRAARAAQLRPALVPTITRIGRSALVPKIMSVGSGPAFNVKVVIALEPDGPSSDFVASVLRPERGQTFILSDPSTHEPILTADGLAKYERLRVRGSCRDALGTTLQVNEEMDLTAFLNAWKSGLWGATAATHRGKPPLEAIEEILDQIEHHIRQMVQPD